MSIQAQVLDDLKEAMINKEVEKRDLLRVLVGEFNKVGKKLNDEQAIKCIKYMVKGATTMSNDTEIKILNTYLPTKLNDAETKAAVQKIIDDNSFNSMANMGATMKAIRDQLGASVDNKVASTYVKEILGS